uniref:CRAL-TRIO domain-containing protein n=1 Tax=Palpitomonas bilix TaxID=652834 RepID=A0A7S3DFT9_9EUKA|mmetsp:Transcript_35792/g.93300  ORF Transcript_35792/g.93300 Transcript_35792/m.93300 type:complete len:268 (+) Transcript_35792:69-872(+)|eukprot:CAMPEP_0113884060 /NCGR_PEP_ID=MMETSP0780_2-20120614/9998_1 /TAXON_ID=652834 /ORGANISM="Palpitomonas bilix" /LENGTH=267 /DNA_ID=CAMNT_0000871539 /DNA_START=69 /DNA_END=872 /DNA_ORIENTATION=+ /assembly_acc=CAM_ASM_000599
MGKSKKGALEPAPEGETYKLQEYDIEITDGQELANFRYLKEDLKDLSEEDKKIGNVDDLRFLQFTRAFRNQKKGHEAAAEALKRTIEWRREYKPLEITNDDVRNEVKTGKAYHFGRDMDGRPALWIHVSLHDKKTRVLEETVKYGVMCMEHCLTQLEGTEYKQRQVGLVFDLTNFGLRNMDYDFVKELLRCLQNYYPENMGKTYVVNAPLIFRGFWAIVKPWIDPFTVQKIQFVNSLEKLTRYFTPANIPKRLGGESYEYQIPAGYE